jgi:hypothetical protein
VGQRVILTGCGYQTLFLRFIVSGLRFTVYSLRFTVVYRRKNCQVWPKGGSLIIISERLVSLYDYGNAFNGHVYSLYQ